MACNTPARMAKGAVETLRERGVKAGLFRPLTLWPFPIDALAPLVRKVERIVMVEASSGQLEDELRLAVSKAGLSLPPVDSVRHCGGVLPQHAEIVERVLAPAARGGGGGMSVFYDTFERHDHGRGLKGHSTTYCPGCGHGLAHKYIADAIEELGIQDRTIAISPVGCSVFLYYYLDVGNSQAAHGRAPAVALGHKLANPESIVISYQGDGDLASIGLAEILSVAQLGIPISVVFVNNAIYGMTGGQMAPTTLMGQKTSTSPYGRTRFSGEPLKVAELMAGLDGPIYVERVALFDAKNRVKAEKAIKKAIRLQVEGKGFSFVEVLAECPTHLKHDAARVGEVGEGEDGADVPARREEGRRARGAAGRCRRCPTTCRASCSTWSAARARRASASATASRGRRWGRDIGIKLAGAGGDGAQTAALLITRAAINEGFDSTHIPSYGPESRGGTSYADVRIAAEEVLSPAAPEPHVLVAFNAPSLAKFGPRVAEGGVVVYDSSVVLGAAGAAPPACSAVGVPFARIAADLGKTIVKNIVALGALQEATRLFPRRDVPGRDPPGARRQVRADPAQRGGVRCRRARGRRGRRGGRVRLEELRPEERRLVEALRAIPPSPLRDRFARLRLGARGLRRRAGLRRDAGRRRAVQLGAGLLRRVPEADGRCSRACARGCRRASARGAPARHAAPHGAKHGHRDTPRDPAARAPRRPHPLGRAHAGAEGPPGLGRVGGRARRRPRRRRVPGRGRPIAYSRHEVFARGSLIGDRLRARPARVRAAAEGTRSCSASGRLPAARPEDFQALAESEVTAIGIEAIEDDARPRAGAHQHVRDRRQPRGDRRQRLAAERRSAARASCSAGCPACRRPTS